MGCMDDSGVIEGGCSICGGNLKWWYFDSDCRGNPPVAGSRCEGCGHEFDETSSSLRKKRKEKKMGIGENESQNKLLIELFRKLKLLPFDEWSFSKNTSDIIVESIKIGSGMGGSIYITVYPNEIITVPKKMNKAWANLYSLISNYLKDKKYKEGQNKKIVALRNAIQQVDDHIKGMNGGW